MPFTVGLAGKDEELFVVCLKELMKAVDVVETEPMVDLLKAFVERQAFGVDVTRSYPSWVLKPCVILASGCCDVCGKQLRKEPLSLAAKHELASEVESLILSRASRSAASDVETRKTKEDRVENFLAFKAFLAKTGPYDIFLDGANIAHYKQNFDGGCFNYQQIQMVAEYLLQQKKRILIVLHEHHFNQAGTTLPEQWLERGLAYKVVKGNNDDLYWMYAALAADNDAMVRTGAGREAQILSNDQMRDHFFHINNDRRFQKWREHNQIYYDIWTDADKKKFALKFPLSYTQNIQDHPSGFHIPYGSVRENMKFVSQYYCLVNTEREREKKCSVL